MRRAAAPRTLRTSSAGGAAALRFLEIPTPRLPALAALPPARPRPAWALGSRSPGQSTQPHCPGYLHFVIFDYAGRDPELPEGRVA